MSKPLPNLALRLISTAVILPIVLLCMFWDSWWFFGLILLVMTLATWEYVRMLRRHGYRAEYAFALLMLWSIILDFYFSDLGIIRPALALLLLASLTWSVLLDKTTTKVENWMLPLAGALYIGWTAGHMLLIRALPRGDYLLFTTFGITWLADSGAYFVGRAIGKHKLAPVISPKKTWEGVLGGIVTAITGGTIIASLGGLGWFHGVLLGLLLSTLTVFGDLGKSIIKREVGVKDSSEIIPGHGGMFDRVDSLLFAAVIGYYYFTWVMGVSP